MAAPRVTRRIVVPLDGSRLDQLILPHLRALATVESEILLLRVSAEQGPIHDLADCHEALRGFARTLRDITPHIATLVRPGSPADEIVRAAEERRADLILMASVRRRGAGGVVDSVAYRVAQAATAPVMIVHPDEAGDADLPTMATYRSIVVPLDGSARAATAVPVATAIARAQNLPLRLLRVEPGREARPARPTSASALLGPETATVHAGGVDATATVLTGPVTEAILGAVDPADVLVISSHGEGGLRPWLLGTVAQKLVTSAPSHLVVVPVEERRELTRAIRGEGLPRTTIARSAPARQPAHAR